MSSKWLVSINPQKHCHAVAFFKWGALHSARIYDNNPASWILQIDQYEELVIEIPQVYAPSHWKGDPNDLIDVAFSAGKVAALFRVVHQVRPHAWKSGIPKPKKASEPYIIEHRARKKLTPEEVRTVIEPGSVKLRYDVWDAVAIGLWHLKR